MKIQIIKGDITKISTDAIVNATNKDMLNGLGVDGAIRKVAGKELYEECLKLRKEIIPKGLPVGEAIVTGAYNLQSNIIIHTVGPKYYSEDLSLLKKCYFNCLRLAEENNCVSIVFPAISTGAYGCPIEKSAEIVKEVLDDFEPQKLNEIILVLFNDKDYEVYQKYFSEK